MEQPLLGNSYRFEAPTDLKLKSAALLNGKYKWKKPVKVSNSLKSQLFN